MACGSGCCGSPPEPSPAPPVDQASQKDRPAQADVENEGCCDNDRKPVKAGDDGCCSAASDAAAANDGCCSADTVEQIVKPSKCSDGCCLSSNIQGGDSCCSSKALDAIANDSNQDDGCCSASTVEQTDKSIEMTQACCSASNARTGDACCSSDAGNTAAVVDVKRDNGCCSPSDASDTKKACCSPSPGNSAVIDNQQDDQSCCAPRDTSKSDSRCKSSRTDGAGENARLDKDAGDRPSCCKGKSYPCCDESCLDTIAIRECRSSSGSSGSACGKAANGRPCSEHAKSARSKYRAKLEALGCICRALVAIGQESCCTKPVVSRRTASVRSRSSAASTKSMRRSTALAAGKSDCKAGCCDVPKPKVSLLDSCADDSCCGEEKSGAASRDSCEGDSCCGAEKPNVTSRDSCSGDSCCRVDVAAAPPASRSLALPTGKASEKSGILDVETKGVAGKERVVLAISGMTCTGCETKLQRTLGTLDSVVNLKTSLVLARVEFDLDLGKSNVEQVIKHLERTTEFKCEQVNVRSSYLDFLTQDNASALVNGDWPVGVTDMKVIDGGKAVRAEFDSQLVGARDLAERGWAEPMVLAAPKGDAGLEAGSKHVRSMGYMTFLSIALTIPVLVMAWAPLPRAELAYSSASLALATVVQVAIAGPFYPKALKSLIFSKVIEMDLLIVLSTSAAYIFSVVSFGYLVQGKPLSTGEFFETSTLLVTLIMVGRYVAALARQRAVESISIRSLQTTTAVLVDDSGTETILDARLLQFGDVFKVAPESKVPTDGTVISGSSEVDESMLTGESIPIEKHKGSVVIAGSVNGSGTLTVRLSRLPEHNTISNIASMVDEAKLSKPKIQEVADRVATYFVPVVLSLTVITFSVWLAVGIAVRGDSAQESAIQAITYAITVLIVSCPCAIGLAVPMVIVISSGMAAERGIVFKTSEAIEVAYKTKHIVFDKTGTLTSGKLTVSEERYLCDDVAVTRPLLLGLVSQSKHPVSQAVAKHFQSSGCKRTDLLDANTVAGKGVEGSLGGKRLRAGNSRWINAHEQEAVRSMLAKGYTVFCFTIDDALVAIFGLEDTLKEDAPSTIKELQFRGIQVHVLSGDDDGAVRAITSRLGIPDKNVRSRCSPADKQSYVRSLTQGDSSGAKGKPDKPVVIFCGDGTNDAVALAEATIGVHMNGGTDVSQSAADTVLVRPNLSKILTIIDISRKSIHRIAFNFGWSFVYNVAAILLASGALVNARIPPEYAGLGELVSVLPVIIAAALLRWSRID